MKNETIFCDICKKDIGSINPDISEILIYNNSSIVHSNYPGFVSINININGYGKLSRFNKDNFDICKDCFSKIQDFINKIAEKSCEKV